MRAIIATTTFEGFQSGVWIAFPVMVTARGRLDIRVDWTLPDTWMYVYFGETLCNLAQLRGDRCPFLIRSEAKDPKPRVLLTEVLNPGTYYVILYNVPRNPGLGIGSDNTEAISVEVGLTSD